MIKQASKSLNLKSALINTTPKANQPNKQLLHYYIHIFPKWISAHISYYTEAMREICGQHNKMEMDQYKNVFLLVHFSFGLL